MSWPAGECGVPIIFIIELTVRNPHACGNIRRMAPFVLVLGTDAGSRGGCDSRRRR